MPTSPQEIQTHNSTMRRSFISKVFSNTHQLKYSSAVAKTADTNVLNAAFFTWKDVNDNFQANRSHWNSNINKSPYSVPMKTKPENQPTFLDDTIPLEEQSPTRENIIPIKSKDKDFLRLMDAFMNVARKIHTSSDSRSLSELRAEDDFARDIFDLFARRNGMTETLSSSGEKSEMLPLDNGLQRRMRESASILNEGIAKNLTDFCAYLLWPATNAKIPAGFTLGNRPNIFSNSLGDFKAAISYTTDEIMEAFTQSIENREKSAKIPSRQNSIASLTESLSSNISNISNSLLSFQKKFIGGPRVEMNSGNTSGTDMKENDFPGETLYSEEPCIQEFDEETHKKLNSQTTASLLCTVYEHLKNNKDQSAFEEILRDKVPTIEHSLDKDLIEAIESMNTDAAKGVLNALEAMHSDKIVHLENNEISLLHFKDDHITDENTKATDSECEDFGKTIFKELGEYELLLAHTEMADKVIETDPLENLKIELFDLQALQSDPDETEILKESAKNVLNNKISTLLKDSEKCEKFLTMLEAEEKHEQTAQEINDIIKNARTAQNLNNELKTKSRNEISR